jgi:hypothetical protein
MVLVEYHIQSIGQGVFFKGDSYHLQKSLGYSGRFVQPILRWVSTVVNKNPPL